MQHGIHRIKSGTVVIGGLLVAVSLSVFFILDNPKESSAQHYDSNISFTYPSDWRVKLTCKDINNPRVDPSMTFIGSSAGNDSAKLRLEGKLSRPEGCVDNKLTADRSAKSTFKCTAEDTDIKLKNGIHITLNHLKQYDYPANNAGNKRVTTILIGSEACQGDLFRFTFKPSDGHQLTNDELLKYREPGVEFNSLTNSPSYKNIVKFAESVKL